MSYAIIYYKPLCNTNVNRIVENKMKKYFSAGKAAKDVHTTSETLRHYNMIGLVKPSKKDECTNYRYYTEQDIVRLNIVRALQYMVLFLQEIKAFWNMIILKNRGLFSVGREKADEKIAALQYSKSKIRATKANYKRKLKEQQNFSSILIKKLPERVILLSNTLEMPTLNNLWNYLSHFYDKVATAVKKQFPFGNLACIYTENGTARLFTIYAHYVDTDGLKVLPNGKYLYANCTEKNRKQILSKLLRTTQTKYVVDPAFTVHLVVSKVLERTCEVQIYVGSIVEIAADDFGTV